jgi:hypothetical protein
VSRFRFPRRFSPLVDLLRGHFSKSSAGLPDNVRKRVAEIFTLPFWDACSSANRRRGALIWASQFELDHERDQQHAFELGFRLEGAKLREEFDVVENRIAARISEFRSLLSLAVDGTLSFEKVSAQLGPALFPNDWIEGLSEKEKWLIDEAQRRPNDVQIAGPAHDPLGLARWVPSNPISRESLDAAKDRQGFVGHLHRKGQDWLQARGIKTEAQFEEAFKREFPQPSVSAAATAAADAPPQRAVKSRGRGGNAQIIDDDHVTKFKQQKINEPSLTIRAFVLMHDKVIQGANVDAKVRRLQMKISKAQ